MLFQIINLLLLPVVIYASYKLARFVLKRFDLEK